MYLPVFEVASGALPRQCSGGPSPMPLWVSANWESDKKKSGKRKGAKNSIILIMETELNVSFITIKQTTLMHSSFGANLSRQIADKVFSGQIFQYYYCYHYSFSFFFLGFASSLLVFPSFVSFLSCLSVSSLFASPLFLLLRPLLVSARRDETRLIE